MTETYLLPTPISHISLREEFDDWALLFNPDTGKSVGLTPTGVTIWRALINRKDLKGIIDALGDEFEPLPENIQEEVTDFCDQIVKTGFAEFEKTV